MSKNIRKSLISLLVIYLFLSPLFIFAQAQFPVGEIPKTSPLLGGTLRETLLNIFWWVFTILTWVAGAFAVLYIIWGGINVIMQAKIDEGKNRLIYGAVGLAIALLSWAIVKFIESLITTGSVGI